MNLENNSAEDPVAEISPEQKKAGRFVTVWTCLYVIFFPSDLAFEYSMHFLINLYSNRGSPP